MIIKLPKFVELITFLDFLFSCGLKCMDFQKILEIKYISYANCGRCFTIYKMLMHI